MFDYPVFNSFCYKYEYAVDNSNKISVSNNKDPSALGPPDRTLTGDFILLPGGVVVQVELHSGHR